MSINTVMAGFKHWISPIAQIPNNSGIANSDQVATPEAASVLFSGPQFFITLISGILLAFAIQLLLTNFSVAAGISVLGRRSSHREDDSHHSDSGIHSTIRKISFGVGLWTLISVSIALFFACYLAVQLSLLTSPRLSAIISLVIWAAYFSLLVWVSSTTVGSLIGSVVQAATSGFQAILGTATAAIGGQAAKQQVVSTAEAVTAAVRKELGAGIDTSQMRRSVETYLQNLRLPGFDLSKIQHDLEGLLNDPEVIALAESGRLGTLDRQAFLNLVSHRSDLSSQEANRLADLVESVWKQTLGSRKRQDSLTELTEYLRSTQTGQLQVNELNQKLDRLLAEQRSSQSNQPTQPTQPANQASIPMMAQSGLNTLVGLLVGRTDLSDLSLDQILQKIRSASSTVSDTVSEQTQKVTDQVNGRKVFSPIETDVEHYLSETYSWQMERETLNREFRQVLYDPQADPEAVIETLSRLNRSRFVELLAARGVFTQTRIQEIADQLEAIRLDVLKAAQAEHEREIVADLEQRIRIYLSTTPKQQLIATDTLPAFAQIIQDDQTDFETLRNRLAIYSRPVLQQWLSQRQDLTLAEQEMILDTLERTRDQVLFQSQSLNEQAKQRYGELQQRLEAYLRNTGKAELDPDSIQQELRLLMKDPATGASTLRQRLAQFDRDTFVKLLSQRQDLSEADVNHILDQVESNWHSLIHAPEQAVQVVKEQSDQTLTKLADYLRQTHSEALDPDGIQRDLQQLYANPPEGMRALRHRLASIDRETLIRLLSQRSDLSEAQMNQTVDQVLGTIQQIVRSPRRLALRTQERAISFEAELEAYLRNTNKEELNPDGIKRDMQLLLESPKLGLRSLGDRISQVDRSTLIALLSQRPDMTPEEAERIVSQIESVRNQMLAQVQQVQDRIKAVIEGIFARIRDYLNSLQRPELNYEGISHDIRQLFDDPQAGFEALRSRLSHFDRGTLVALLSSRPDISEAQANRIIDQIDGARMGVLQQAERVQTETQRRLEAIKLQAQRQLDETRKAAATAAWWLFATALVSAVAAAMGGLIAAS